MIYPTVQTKKRAWDIVEEYATYGGYKICCIDDTKNCHCECGETNLLIVEAIVDGSEIDLENGTNVVRIECAYCDSCGDDDIEMNEVVRSYSYQVQHSMKR